MSRYRRLFAPLLAVLLVACAAPEPEQRAVTLTLVGTNDVHGALLAQPERGGIVALSANIESLRAARAADGGAVLVIDAGDMWQGTIESNLTEGEAVVAAYNAIGVTAAAIGNHEFDFGPAGDAPTPKIAGDDPQGALKQRAREAKFPLLAANLIDLETGNMVDWDNVRASTVVDIAGIEVGIIGVMTEHALATTISANTVGLSVAPLAPTIAREAARLRESGVDLVVVAAHAGSRCTSFDDPDDTSSCRMDGEIMRVAMALPPGLVDHIFAGHVHQGIAHIVNGISITSSYSNARAFSRTDFQIDPASGEVLGRKVFPPQQALMTGSYEGHALRPDDDVVDVAAQAAQAAAARKQETLGIELLAPFELVPDVESALSNIMTEALLDSVDGDIVIHNVFGGIRSGLPGGPLTYGSVYEMFPFDNIVWVHELSGAELREVISAQAAQRRRAGFAGMRVYADCADGQLQVTMRLDDGTEIGDADVVRIVANDFLAMGGDNILTPVIPDGGFALNHDMPRTRDVLVDWFRSQAGPLDPAAYRTHDRPKWNVPDAMPATCTL